MKILITGGLGFIGSNLAIKLLDMGHEVVIFDCKLNRERLRSDHDRATLMEGDVLDLPDLTERLTTIAPDVIIHLPALRNLESQEKPYQAHMVNSSGMVNLLEAARVTSVKRVVYASSVAVYGSPGYYRSLNLDPFCVKEWMPVNPYNVYGATKLYDEMMATQYMAIYGFQTIGLRLAIVIGPGKTPGSKTSEFNDIIESPVRGKAVTIGSCGDQKVNLIFLHDAIHGFICACSAEAPKHPVYNLGGHSISTRELVEAVRKLFPKAPVSLLESQTERAVASAIDSSLAKEELGYEPAFSLEEAIKEHHKSISGSA